MSNFHPAVSDGGGGWLSLLREWPGVCSPWLPCHLALVSAQGAATCLCLRGLLLAALRPEAYELKLEEDRAGSGGQGAEAVEQDRELLEEEGLEDVD